MSRSSPFCFKKEGIESVGSHRPGKAHGMAHIPLLTLRRQAGGYAPQTPLYCSAWGKGYPQGRSWRQCENFQHYATPDLEFKAWKVKKGKTFHCHSFTFLGFWVGIWDVLESLWKPRLSRRWGRRAERVGSLSPPETTATREELSPFYCECCKMQLGSSWWSLLVWQTCANMMCPKVLQRWVDASRFEKLWFIMIQHECWKLILLRLSQGLVRVRKHWNNICEEDDISRRLIS